MNTIFRPFRCLNSDLKTPAWSKVDKLVQGQVYQQGNINDFIKMTKWDGGIVLYFGDHVFTDLAVSMHSSVSFVGQAFTDCQESPVSWVESLKSEVFL